MARPLWRGKIRTCCLRIIKLPTQHVLIFPRHKGRAIAGTQGHEPISHTACSGRFDFSGPQYCAGVIEPSKIDLSFRRPCRYVSIACASDGEISHRTTIEFPRRAADASACWLALTTLVGHNDEHIALVVGFL